jgi:predicted transcriptional regulator
MCMRTTVEITDEQRARLLEIAGRRGEKGFSRLVQEAIDLYLERLTRNDEAVDDALAVIGSFSENAAGRLEHSVREIRGRWR